jgi:hypothetical protein
MDWSHFASKRPTTTGYWRSDTVGGGIEVTGRLGRKRRKLLDDLKERRGYSHLKEEALDYTMWRARFGRGFGPVVRQKKKKKNLRLHTQTQTQTHRICNTYSFSTATMVTRRRLIVTLHLHFLSC